MDKKSIGESREKLEAALHEADGTEFWLVRELSPILGCDRWENFTNVLVKSRIACANSGQGVEDHFCDATKMIDLPKRATRTIDDVAIAQNGDPRKEQIAFAQSNFALQTRKQELIEERIALGERLAAREKLRDTETELAKNIFERGVDSQGLATEMTNFNVKSLGTKAPSTSKKPAYNRGPAND